MRLKRLMSIVLATLLVMSFAMSASAGSLYFSFDFPGAETASYTTWRSGYPVQTVTDAEGNVILGSNGGIFNNPDFVALRELGHNLVIAGSFSNTDDNTYFVANEFGNNMIVCKSVSTQHDVLFIPDSSWDGSANLGETYVISYDTQSTADHALAVGSRAATVWGLKNDGTYTEGNVASVNYGGVGLTFNNVGTYREPTLALTAGEAVRIAYGFNYDTNLGQLVRQVAVDAESVLTNSTWALGNVKTIEAFNTPLGAKHPSTAKVRMYTVDSEFNVTAPISGEKRVPVDYGTITLTFDRPIADASLSAVAIAVTKNGDTVDGVVVGDIETGVVNGSYVSTVDVDFALEGSSDYVITVSGVKDELGNTLADGTISFSTPKPDLTMSAPTITNATVGAMSEASVAVTNNSESSKDVSVIYAVYTSAGKLVDVVYANDTIASEKTASISAGIKLGADAAKAKVMIWDGLNAISPVTGFVGVDVAQ